MRDRTCGNPASSTTPGDGVHARRECQHRTRHAVTSLITIGAVMRQLIWSTLAILLVVSTLDAQTRTIAERLGYPRTAKLLILHADDLGVAHSENAASFDALDKGAVTSASVMMPTPWVTEVARYAQAHPNHDIGLHLTLTSEWNTYRSGGLAPRDQVPSLYDLDGTFPRGTDSVAGRAKNAEVEREPSPQNHPADSIWDTPTPPVKHKCALFETPRLFWTIAKGAPPA